MSRDVVRLSSFALGVINKKLWSRPDWEGYNLGLADAPNMIAMVEGGAEKRPGFFRQSAAYQSASADPDARGRVMDFSRSALEGFLIEFSDLSLRIWDVSSGALVVDENDVPIELVTPWPSSALGRLVGVPRVDTLILLDNASQYKPKILARQSATQWTLIDYDFREGPLKPGNSDINLSLSGTTLSANAAFFEAGHVGALIRLRENPVSINRRSWNAGMNLVDADVGDNFEYSGRVYTLLGPLFDDPDEDIGKRTGTAAPIHAEGTRSDGNQRFSFLHDGGGYVRITAVASPTSATVENAGVGVVPTAAQNTPYWDIQAFNDFDGWPAAGTYHQERLFLGGTFSEPETVYGCRTADYDAQGANFKPGLGSGLVADDDALRLLLADGTSDGLVFLISADDLYSGGGHGVRKIRGPANEEPITPAGAIARSAGAYGAARGVMPRRVGDFLIFSGLGRRVLRGLTLDGAAVEISRHASQLIVSGVEHVAHEKTTKTLWIVTRAGELIAMRFDPNEGVEAMTPIELVDDGRVESLAVVRRADGIETVWAQISFKMGEARIRELCVLSRRWEIGMDWTNLCYLDRAGYFDADVVAPDPETESGGVTSPPPETGGTGGNDGGGDGGGGDDGTGSGSGYDDGWDDHPPGNPYDFYDRR
jgi:hypothetical protein